MLPRRVKGLGALSFIGLIGLAVLVDFSFSFFFSLNSWECVLL